MEENANTEKESKHALDLTWQDTDQLRKYTTNSGRILPRKFTRLTSKEQRHVARTIKHARNLLQML
jgi:small subunit ribosomal protein S18